MDRVGRVARKPKPKAGCRSGDSDGDSDRAARGAEARSAKPAVAKAAARAPRRHSSFVQEQPGITIPELASRMGIKQNYLYRVLPILEEEGKVTKQGRGWHPKG